MTDLHGLTAIAIVNRGQIPGKQNRPPMVLIGRCSKNPNSRLGLRASTDSAIFNQKMGFSEFRLLCRNGAGLAMVLHLPRFPQNKTPAMMTRVKPWLGFGFIIARC